jgi:uncharacterized membrane protein
MAIDYTRISLPQWLLIILFILLGLACLIAVLRQFRSSNVPGDNKKRLIRSIISGLLAGGFSTSLLLVWGVFLWIETGNIKSMFFAFLPILCLSPIIIVIMVGISFLQFWYTSKLKQYISQIGISEYDKKNDKLV